MSREQYEQETILDLGDVLCSCGCQQLATQFFKGELPNPVPIAEPSCYLTLRRLYRERQPQVLEHFRNQSQFELTRRLQTT
jgi:hypothetical protein